MWFKLSKRYFCKIQTFAYGEINEWNSSNPTSWWQQNINSTPCCHLPHIIFQIKAPHELISNHAKKHVDDVNVLRYRHSNVPTFRLCIVLYANTKIKSKWNEMIGVNPQKYADALWFVALKKKCHQFDNFVVTSGTISCLYDNLRHHQWRQCCQTDDLSFSVCASLLFW